MTTPLSGQSEAPEPPRGHVRIVYLGPVAPHWEIESEFGERPVIEAFRERALARLVLLPPHDPQFRRNRERVVRGRGARTCCSSGISGSRRSPRRPSPENGTG